MVSRDPRLKTRPRSGTRCISTSTPTQSPFVRGDFGTGQDAFVSAHRMKFHPQTHSKRNTTHLDGPAVWERRLYNVIRLKIARYQRVLKSRTKREEVSNKVCGYDMKQKKDQPRLKLVGIRCPHDESVVGHGITISSSETTRIQYSPSVKTPQGCRSTVFRSWRSLNVEELPLQYFRVRVVQSPPELQIRDAISTF